MIKNYARVTVALSGGSIALLLLVAGGCRHSRPEGYQGIVEFEERVLGFETPGRVESISVRRGDDVAAGAVLATLDTGLAEQLRNARAAELAAARARLDLLRAGSRREDARAVDAQLESARSVEALARKTVERQLELSAGGASPPAALEAAQADLRRVEAERTVLEQRRTAMREGARPQEIAVAEAAVDAASAGLAAEEERLARHTLRALFAGRVTDVPVKAGEITGAGSPVVIVADTRHPFVDVFVPQGKTGGLRVGDPARVTVDSLHESLTGSVEDVGRKTEFTPRFLFSERERPNLVIRVRVRVDDPQERLLSGLPAQVTIETAGNGGDQANGRVAVP